MKHEPCIFLFILRNKNIHFLKIPNSKGFIVEKKSHLIIIVVVQFYKVTKPTFQKFFINLIFNIKFVFQKLKLFLKLFL